MKRLVKSAKKKKKVEKCVKYIFKYRSTSGASIINFEHILDFKSTINIAVFITLLLLIYCLSLEPKVSDNKFVTSNCEKYIVLWAGEICGATCFHSNSPNKAAKE